MLEANLAKLTQRIKDLRIKLGLTQAAVAQEIGVNKSTITRWEKGQGVGRINHGEVLMLANTFNVSPNYLLGWIDEPLTPEAEAVTNALNDVDKLYRDILENPLSAQDPQNSILNRRILSKVMMINQACLTTPEIRAQIGDAEAQVAIKYLLTYYGIPWESYNEGLLYKLLGSDLMRNFVHNSLGLLQQSAK